MFGEVTKQANCRLCGGSNFTRLFSLRPSPIADAFTFNKDEKQFLYPLDLEKCTNCDFSQILDVVSPDQLYKNYIYVTSSSMGLDTHFESFAEKVIGKLALPEGSLAIDIGSNDGSLLKSLKKRGMKVVGCEPATMIAKDANAAGIKTHCEFFSLKVSEMIAREDGHADLITMNNLYANIPDLKGVTSGIRNLLKPDGVYVFETFYFLDYIRNMVFDFMYHEHINFFSVKPLKQFFASMGMELFHVEGVPTKGGSIRCFVQKQGAKRPVDPSVNEYLKKEESAQLHHPDHQIFDDFIARVDRLGIELKTLLEKYKSEGKSIACYGASCTTTTLLYHFDCVHLIDYLLDDNAAKHGSYSPLAKLPVRPGDEIYTRKPDVTLVAAWRFADQIMKKHARYLKENGIFIVPVPEIRVVKT